MVSSLTIRRYEQFMTIHSLLEQSCADSAEVHAESEAWDSVGRSNSSSPEPHQANKQREEPRLGAPASWTERALLGLIAKTCKGLLTHWPRIFHIVRVTNVTDD